MPRGLASIMSSGNWRKCSRYHHCPATATHHSNPQLPAAISSPLSAGPSSPTGRFSLDIDIYSRHGYPAAAQQPGAGTGCGRHPLTASRSQHRSIRTLPQRIRCLSRSERGIGSQQPRHSREHCTRGPARCFSEQLQLFRPARRAHKGLQRCPALPGCTLAVYGIASHASVLVHGSLRIAKSLSFRLLCQFFPSS